MKNKYIRLSSLLFSVMTYGFICNECETSLHDSYLYTVDINPEKFSYEVGEHIELSYKLGSRFTLEGTKVDYDNSDFNTNNSFSIMKLSKNNNTPEDGSKDFLWIPVLGTIEHRTTYLEIRFANSFTSPCDADSCNLILKLEPLEAGDYLLRTNGGRFGDPANYCEYLSMKSNGFNVSDNNSRIADELGIETIFTPQGTRSEPNSEIKEFFFFKVE